MLDVQKQIFYWISNAESDLESAGFLIKEKQKILHGLFFCHLTIEKAIKAHITKKTGEVPPRSHDLLYLLSKTALELTQDDLILCGILMKYQLHGRYPEYNPNVPDTNSALSILSRTENLLLWIKNKL